MTKRFAISKRFRNDQNVMNNMSFQTQQIMHKESALCLDKPNSSKPDEVHMPAMTKCSRLV